MRAIAQEVRRAASTRQQKSDRREISFGRVASLAREDEIVAPIVCRLAASWGHVIERHQDRRVSLATISADGSVLLEKPSPRFGVGDPARWMRRELERPVRCASFGALLTASGATSPA